MFAILMIISGALLRLLPHLPNFTPIGGMAIFGGSKLNNKSSLAILFAVMLLSDYLLLYINPFGSPYLDFRQIKPISAMFHATTIYVYTSLVISFFIGKLLKRINRPGLFVGASLIASIQFFLITNFGVWAAGYYPPTINGLFESYIEGLPFFQWTVLGDLFYTTLFFTAFELGQRFAQKRYVKA